MLVWELIFHVLSSGDPLLKKVCMLQEDLHVSSVMVLAAMILEIGHDWWSLQIVWLAQSKIGLEGGKRDFYGRRSFDCKVCF
ncbi:hypothetical protein MTR67_026685 [Solanum verrucosum]|uniref:Uncharacterized protein n=1 Tax=Solanum verrucosum TaxID=315347 RepID=A0AAF0R600_SOLVR|nr:hypothetical protein MTR67_026685 [Solanum verrucosum]